MDGTCLSGLTDGLFVASSPVGRSDLQRLHLVDLTTGQVDACDVQQSYVDMIHIIR